jgi:hypothetical protein
MLRASERLQYIHQDVLTSVYQFLPSTSLCQSQSRLVMPQGRYYCQMALCQTEEKGHFIYRSLTILDLWSVEAPRMPTRATSCELAFSSVALQRLSRANP